MKGFKIAVQLSCLLLFTTLSVCSTSAQDRGSVGLGSPSGPYIPEPSAAERIQFERKFKTSIASNQPVRVVNGKPYNIVQSDSWKVVEGILDSQINGVIILQKTIDFGRTGTYIAVTNSGQMLTANQRVDLAAIRNGTFNFSGKPIELWDCGTLYIPPPLTPDQIRNVQESAQNHLIRAKQRSSGAQSNAIIWLAPQATNGTASAQYSLAIHYLNGQGCDTNRDLALHWLNKSAAQGNEEAIHKLSELKTP